MCMRCDVDRILHTADDMWFEEGDTREEILHELEEAKRMIEMCIEHYTKIEDADPVDRVREN